MFRGCRIWLALLVFCLPIFARATDDDFQLGVKALQARDYDLALSCFNAALQLNPALAAAYEGRGLAYAGKQAYERAIADQTEAIRLAPKVAGTYYNRGNARLCLKDYDSAIADFTQALDTNPNYTEALNNRGLAHAAKHEWDLAITDHTDAILLDNNRDATLLLNRGLDFQGKQDYEKAEFDFSEAIRLDPKLTLAYYLRGNVETRAKAFDEALEDYDEAIRLDPTPVNVWNNRGIVLVNLREYDRAINDFTEAIRHDPRRAASYFNRGLALAGKKDNDRALAEYEEAVRLDPEQARTNGLILADLPAVEKDRSDETMPTYGDVYFERGNERFRKRDYDGALADYSRSLRLKPGDAKVLNCFVKAARTKVVTGDLPSFSPETKYPPITESNYHTEPGILPAAAWTPPETAPIRPSPPPAPLALVSDDIPELPQPQAERTAKPTPAAPPRPAETVITYQPAPQSAPPAADAWFSPALMFYSVILAALVTGVAIGSIPVLLLLTRFRKTDSNAIDVRELVTVLMAQHSVPVWNRGSFPPMHELRPETPPRSAQPEPEVLKKDEFAEHPEADLIRNILAQNLKLHEEEKGASE